MSTTTSGERPTTSWSGIAMLSTNVAIERPPACPDCVDTGYVMQDRGTSLYPDYIEVNCACNPAPTDEEYPGHRLYTTVGDDWSSTWDGLTQDAREDQLLADYEPSADWETNNRFNDALYEGF